jgi:uncharacterized protein (TIRG00374 family)
VARRRWVRWALRIVGLGLMALVLLTQVRWHDTLTRVDGSVLEGRVQHAPGGYRVEPRDGGPAQHVTTAEVAQRTLAQRSAPDVVLGLPSLTARLAGRLPTLAAVLALLAAMVALTAWRWDLLVAALDLALGFGTALRLTFVGLFFNIAVPGATGGDVVKAWYAARRLGAGARAVVSVLVDRLIGLFGLVLMAGLALLLAPADAAYATARLLVLASLAGGVVLAAILLSRRLRNTLGLGALARRLPFAHRLREADAALRLYRRRPRSIVAALALSLVNHAGMVVAAALLAQALGMHALGWAPLFVVVPLASLASAVPLLPGGWGVGELAYAFLLAPFGVEPTEAVGLSVMLRLLQVAVSLPGGALWILKRDATSPQSMEADLARAEQDLGRAGTATEDACTDPTRTEET